ncbi:MAG: DNA repair protein RadC [Tissierellia bacterium]|nr:DNA repair protein RadC [Tissierellia bacterium]
MLQTSESLTGNEKSDLLYSNLTIKDMPIEDRPRERLIKYGAKSLTTVELLAIIIGTGTKQESAIQIAQRLLNVNNGEGLEFLATASSTHLMKIPGIKKAKATNILAAIELGRRTKAVDFNKLNEINSPKSLADVLMHELEFETKEVFQIASLDVKKRLLAIDVITSGVLDCTVIHPREVFAQAVNRNAHTIILIHNHPSGNSEPSIEDKKTTKRMVEAGKIMGIQVIDHLVIGRNQYFSFLENNII